MATAQQFRDPFAFGPAQPSPQRLLLTAKELDSLQQAEVDWIVKGLLARGCLTELSAELKHGKTTFAAEMVRAIHEQRPFLGLPTSPARVIWMTEQGLVTFRQALRRAHLAEYERELRVFLRQSAPKLPWDRLVCHLVEEDERLGGQGVLIVDTLSRCAGLGPDQENDAGAAAKVMEPLLHAAKTGMAVLTLRHARKGSGDVASAGRGSSAFAGDADIMLLLRRPPRRDDDDEHLADRSRTRILEAVSRFDETPGQDEPVTVRLTNDGYGIPDANLARTQRLQDIDEQILLYVAAHAGCTKRDIHHTASIRGQASTRDDRVAYLVAEAKLLERDVQRPDSLGRSQTRIGLFVAPDA